MNSVHEPGSRTMSKNRLRNNTKSKRIENRPSAPSAQPKASPRAQAAPPAPRPPSPALSAVLRHSHPSCDTGCPKLYCNTVFFSSQIAASVLQYNLDSNHPAPLLQHNLTSHNTNFFFQPSNLQYTFVL